MAHFKSPWDGKHEHWTEIRAHIRINLLQSDYTDFGFGMDWMQFCVMLPQFYSGRDFIRIEKFKKKIWNKCMDVQKRPNLKE